MADYNSPYTGSEIDAAIAKTGLISEYVDLYNGSPTNTGVLLSSLAENPKTGDRSGLYYIIFNSSTVPPEQSGSILSTMYIASDTSGDAGTSAVGMGTLNITAYKAKYNQGTTGADGKIHAFKYDHPFGSGSANETEYYIHRIVRIQEVA